MNFALGCALFLAVFGFALLFLHCLSRRHERKMEDYRQHYYECLVEEGHEPICAVHMVWQGAPCECDVEDPPEAA